MITLSLVGAWQLEILNTMSLPFSSQADFGFATWWFAAWGLLLGFGALVGRSVFLYTVMDEDDSARFKCNPMGVSCFLLAYVYHFYRWPTFVALACTESSSLMVLSYWLDWCVFAAWIALYGLAVLGQLLICGQCQFI